MPSISDCLEKKSRNHKEENGHPLKALSSKEKAKVSIKSASKTVQRGCHWFWKDMKKRHLLWVKVIFLFQSASLVALYPYLTIHMRSLGFAIEDTAIVNSAVPLADVFGPPIAGFLADKIGNFRMFMAVVTFLNGAASLLLLVIPAVKTDLEMCCQGRLNETATTNLECVPRDWSEPPWTILTTDDINVSSMGTLAVHSRDFRCNDPQGALSTFKAHLVHLSVNQTRFHECAQSDHMTSCRVSVNKNWQDWSTSFASYLGVRVLLDILRASSLMLFEGAVVVIIKEHGGDYGLQKLFGTAGAVIFSPLAGKIIDWSSYRSGREDYSAVFILYFIIRAITSLLILKLSLGFKPPAKKVFKNLTKVLCKPNVLAYLVSFLTAGLLWGFLETFLFWFMEDLGATKFLMGLSLAVGTLAGVPVTIFSRVIISKLGHHFVILTTLVIYSCRMLGYSFIQEPKMVFVLEFLKPLCTTLLIISAMTFVKDVSTLTTVATMEGIFGSLYFGVGRGLGGLIGAYSWELIGPRLTFQLLSTLAMGSGVFYSIIMLAHRKLRSNKYKLPHSQSTNDVHPPVGPTVHSKVND
ncbi:hypothetical protein TCAL_04104 [Tigriopus californicus]|uniref:Major facilitator superfamily associated domain-containing protein n=2 Tax=Tigriopus californicus TaxID=6832 RepID=A0A553NV88_TIGCA|nr:hypothetical protein TCAL_04104 [Tigriopus californicus]|eukprot:TCALIF_04104-PA protein Name:"Similar to Mfsd6 Major facilitator superfamily domain-containing protein 6 (Mus musculus)" AED:0.01 eAED:0.02 QI:0/-1/0/1/-1/1/1/0/579